MSYSRFAIGFSRHKKIRDLSDAAFRLWASAIDFAREENSCGRLRAKDLDLLPSFPRGKRRTAAADELVRAGLWEETPDGWLIHDYLHWQDNPDQVRERQREARERMRVVRANRKRTSSEPDNERSAHVQGGSSESFSSDSDPLPSSPDPDPDLPENSGSPSARDGETRAKVRKIFEFWQREHGHPTAKLDTKRDTRIRARLREGFEVRQLCIAIRNAKNDPFLMGENDTRRRYDGIETLLRDAAQVERLAALVAAPSGKKPEPDAAELERKRAAKASAEANLAAQTRQQLGPTETPTEDAKARVQATLAAARGNSEDAAQ